MFSGRSSLIRITVLGCGGTGKSAIVHQFLAKEFLSDWDPTVLDTHTGKREVDGRELSFEINDTSGFEDLQKSIFEDYVTKADCFLLVYSVGAKGSFQVIPSMIEQIKKLKSKAARVPIVLAGNFMDQIENKELNREVSQSAADGLAMATELCVAYEVTAQSHTDCEKLFLTLFRLWLQGRGHQAATTIAPTPYLSLSPSSSSPLSDLSTSPSSLSSSPSSFLSPPSSPPSSYSTSPTAILSSSPSPSSSSGSSISASLRIKRKATTEATNWGTLLKTIPRTKHKRIFTLNSMPFYLPSQSTTTPTTATTNSSGGGGWGGGGSGIAARSFRHNRTFSDGDADEEEVIPCTGTLFSGLFAARQYENGTVLVSHIQIDKAQRIDYPHKILDWCFEYPYLVMYYSNCTLHLYDCNEKKIYTKEVHITVNKSTTFIIHPFTSSNEPSTSSSLQDDVEDATTTSPPPLLISPTAIRRKENSPSHVRSKSGPNSNINNNINHGINNNDNKQQHLHLKCKAHKVALLDDIILFVAPTYLCKWTIHDIKAPNKAILKNALPEDNNSEDNNHNNSNNSNTILLDARLFTPVKFVGLFKRESLEDDNEGGAGGNRRRRVLIGGHQNFQIWDVIGRTLLLEGSAAEKEVESFLRFDCFYDTVVGCTSMNKVKVWVVGGEVRPENYPVIIKQQNLVFGVHIDFVSIVLADTKGNISKISRMSPVSSTQQKKSRKERMKELRVMKGTDKLQLQWMASSYKNIRKDVLREELANSITHLVTHFKYIICGHHNGLVAVWDGHAIKDPGATPFRQRQCSGTIVELNVDRESGAVVVATVEKKGPIRVVVWNPSFEFGVEVDTSATSAHSVREGSRLEDKRNLVRIRKMKEESYRIESKNEKEKEKEVKKQQKKEKQEREKEKQEREKEKEKENVNEEKKQVAFSSPTKWNGAALGSRRENTILLGARSLSFSDEGQYIYSLRDSTENVEGEEAEASITDTPEDAATRPLHEPEGDEEAPVESSAAGTTQGWSAVSGWKQGRGTGARTAMLSLRRTASVPAEIMTDSLPQLSSSPSQSTWPVKVPPAPPPRSGRKESLRAPPPPPPRRGTPSTPPATLPGEESSGLAEENEGEN